MPTESAAAEGTADGMALSESGRMDLGVGRMVVARSLLHGDSEHSTATSNSATLHDLILESLEGLHSRERAMQPTVYQPHGAITRFVEYFWTCECRQDDAVVTLQTFANVVSGIIFQHHNGRSALGPTLMRRHLAGNGDVPTSFVYGKRTQPNQTFATGPFALTGVVFKPQGLSTLLNIHPAQVNNGPIALDEFGKKSIGEELLNARSQHERLVRLSEFLRAHVDASQPEDALVTGGLDLIHQGIHSIRVPRLLDSLGISERQFERRFVRAVGVSPHHYIRIVRFQEAVRRIKTYQFERLSDLAYDLNYADQSHFIKDIKQFSGCTPTTLVQSVQTCIELPCALILAPRTSLPVGC